MTKKTIFLSKLRGFTSNKMKCFTLIEILVVVIIIGIITAIVVPYYINARKDARDSRRISDLQSVATALEQYYAQNKIFPATPTDAGPIIGCDPTYGWCKSTTLPTSWVPTISPTYMSVLPRDPLNSSSSYYVYTTLSANGVNYKLISIGMEGDKGKQAAREDGGCRTDQYELFSAGAKSWRYGGSACDQ